MRTTFSASETSPASPSSARTRQGTGWSAIENLVLDQRLHGLEAPSAGDHGVALGSVLSRLIGADDQVLQQSEGGDGSLELGVGAGIGRGLADVLGGEREPNSAGSPG